MRPDSASGSGKSNGNAPVQTFAWASYVSPGIYARPDGGTDWALQDIHAISHEIAEWARRSVREQHRRALADPYRAAVRLHGILETGDPVVGIGFAMGTNTYEQGPNPNGTQSADGYYHPEDEAFLPWFMRTAPNTISEPTQTPSRTSGATPSWATSTRSRASASRQRAADPDPDPLEAPGASPGPSCFLSLGSQYSVADPYHLAFMYFIPVGRGPSIAIPAARAEKAVSGASFLLPRASLGYARLTEEGQWTRYDRA